MFGRFFHGMTRSRWSGAPGEYDVTTISEGVKRSANAPPSESVLTLAAGCMEARASSRADGRKHVEMAGGSRVPSIMIVGQSGKHARFVGSETARPG